MSPEFNDHSGDWNGNHGLPYLPVHNMHLLPAKKKKNPKHDVRIYTESFVLDERSS